MNSVSSTVQTQLARVQLPKFLFRQRLIAEFQPVVGMSEQVLEIRELDEYTVNINFIVSPNHVLYGGRSQQIRFYSNLLEVCQIHFQVHRSVS